VLSFFSEDIDTEEPPAGWDIAQETRSHFTELLMAGNQELVRAIICFCSCVNDSTNATNVI
jgi:hypothetical protein